MSAEQKIVIDFGSATTRAGFAGSDAPRALFDSTFGRPRYRRLLGGGAQSVVGPEPRLRPLFSLTRPVARGALASAAVEPFVDRVWAELRPQPSDLKVLLTDPLHSSLAGKLALAETLVGRGASHVFFGAQPVLSLFAYGRTEGLLLEVGEGLTQLVALYGGCRLAQANEKVDFAGADLTRHFGELLQRAGALDDAADAFLCEAVKRALLEALPRKAAGAQSAAEYTLPDGERVAVGAERFEAAEALFAPQLAGADALPLAQLLVEAVRRLDIELRQCMFEAVHVAGGTAMTAGFAARLAAEISALVAERTHVRVAAPARDTALLAWTGGSALCQLAALGPMWVSAAELAESGERVFLKKAL